MEIDEQALAVIRAALERAEFMAAMNMLDTTRAMCKNARELLGDTEPPEPYERFDDQARICRGKAMLLIGCLLSRWSEVEGPLASMVAADCQPLPPEPGLRESLVWLSRHIIDEPRETLELRAAASCILEVDRNHWRRAFVALAAAIEVPGIDTTKRESMDPRQLMRQTIDWIGKLGARDDIEVCQALASVVSAGHVESCTQPAEPNGKGA